MSNQALVRLLKFTLAFALIYWLTQKGLLEIAEVKSLFRLDTILILTLLAAGNLLLANWRWIVLLNARGFGATFGSTYQLALIGLFFNYALPGAVSGDVIKGFYVAQENPQRKMEAVTTVMIDRILGLYCMVGMALASIFLDIPLLLSSPAMKAFGLATAGLFLGMTVFFMIVFSKRLTRGFQLEKRLKKLPMGGKFHKIFEAVHLYSHSRGAVIWALVLSLLSQLVAVAFVYAVGYLLGDEQVGVQTYLFAVPIGFIVSAVPILPAGIGVGQVAFSYLFRVHSHTDTSIGQTAITAYQIVTFALSLLGAIFYLLRKKPTFDVNDARDAGSA